MTWEEQCSSTPCRSVRWRALIVLVPAVLNPLIDAAAHVVESKGIWLEAAHLDRLLGGRDVGAIPAIGHARLKLVAPPVLGLGTSASRIFPFSFAWKPVRLPRRGRKPGDILLGIAPAYIRDRRIILAGRRETTCLGGRAFVPFANRDRILTDGERLYRDLAGWLLRGIVIAPHREGSATNGLHLGLSDRRGQLRG